MTKMGQRKDPNKSPTRMKRSPLRKVSKKQATENAELKKLVDKLKILSGNRSELNGEFSPYLEPHHLSGRSKHLCDPFSIIFLTRPQHSEEQKHMSFVHKETLRAKVRVIRLSQGFKEEDYK